LSNPNLRTDVAGIIPTGYSQPQTPAVNNLGLALEANPSGLLANTNGSNMASSILSDINTRNPIRNIASNANLFLSPGNILNNAKMLIKPASKEFTQQLLSDIAESALKTKGAMMNDFILNFPIIEKGHKNSLDCAKALAASDYADDAKTVAVQALAESVSVCQLNVSCDEITDSYTKSKMYAQITATAFQNATAAAELAGSSYQNAQSNVGQTAAEQNNAKNAKIACDKAKQAAERTEALAKASAIATSHCEIMLNLTCVNYVRPKPSNFAPIMQTCDQMNDLSCSFSNLSFKWLPNSFYVTANLVVLGNTDGYYLNCQPNGEIKPQMYSTVPTNKWSVEHIGRSVFAFKSYSGGYLKIDSEGSVTCNSFKLCEENYFTVIQSKNLCEQDDPNYIAIRSFNGNYLSITNTEVSSQPLIYSTNELLKGINFDISRSKCSN
jgi:hypothetical protein